MNRKFSILVFLIASQLTLIGQNLYNFSVKELDLMLDTIIVDKKLKVDVYNEIAYKLRDSEITEAKSYAKNAIVLADSINHLLGKSFSQVILGLIGKREKKIDLAEKYFLKALSIRIEVGSKKDIASVYNNLGLLFGRNNSTKANEYYKSGLNILKEHPQSSTKAVIHNNYGSFLTQEQEFDKALLHLDSSLIIRRNKKPGKALGNSYLNLAFCYYELDNSSQFKIHIDSSLLVFNNISFSLGKAKCYNLIGEYYFKKRKLDEAKTNFERAISLSDGSIENEFRFLRNLGAVEIKKGELDKALKINNDCLAYFEEIKDDREVASLLINTGTIYYEQSKYKEAVEYYQKALDKLKSIKDLALESKALLFLSASYTYLGQLEKAADVSVYYLQIRDQYFQQKANSLNSILDGRDLLVQNAELKLNELENELELKKMQAEKMRTNMILGGGVIFFLFLIAVALAIFYKQKKEIADLKINDLLAANERNANYARLEEQESVRNKIAKDLHDRVGSMLTAIKFSIGSVESRLSDIKEENKEHYIKVNQLIDETCDEVRNIAHDLQNSTLANFGLKAALESLAQSLEGKIPQIQLKVHDLDERLSNKIEVNTYLIIQEIIANTFKHAKANKLTIQLNRFENILNITTEDDGVGFIRKKIKPGMGLNNIESRVYELEGTFILDSGKGSGTTIMIDIPLDSTKK